MNQTVIPVPPPRRRLCVGAAARTAMLARPALALANHLLGLTELDERYQRLPQPHDYREFLDSVLAALGVAYEVDATAIARIPVHGAAIIVANHPFGGLDGVVIAHLLSGLRPDLRIVANGLLARIVELDPILIPVDPFGGAKALTANLAGARTALRWLRQGGLLLTFPAGAVSHFSPEHGRVTDPRWSSSVASLARLSGAPVVPLFVGGRNSDLFQLSGLLHQRVRTALLARELLNKTGTRVCLRIGAPVPAAQLRKLPTDIAATDFLRLKTYLLGAADESARPALARRKPAPWREPIRPEVPAALLRAEIDHLPPERRLLSSGDCHVFLAGAAEIPWLLQEIGRLREIAFRAAGEGTGHAADIDLYDAYYQHLFIWDDRAQRVVGGYRLGVVAEIVERYGLRGLYTHSLFRLAPRLRRVLAPAIELGRSFVRVEAQRSFAPLMLLWRGIGAFIARRPELPLLIGPVSVSNDYHPISRQLLIRFLRQHRMEPGLAAAVRPRNPVQVDARPPYASADLASLDLPALSDLITGVESDQRGVPILLRQYLKLGGRILGFNVDPDFGDVIDCLLLVDLREMDPTLLERYLGADGSRTFLARHAPPVTQTS